MNITPKIDSSGTLYKVPLENTTVLNIFTKAGNYRGGKIYSEEKNFTLISGSVEVTVNIGEKDIKNTYSPGLIFNIPANIPNLFFFPEDSLMLEWFTSNAETGKFKKYSDLNKE